MASLAEIIQNQFRPILSNDSDIDYARTGNWDLLNCIKEVLAELKTKNADIFYSNPTFDPETIRVEITPPTNPQERQIADQLAWEFMLITKFPVPIQYSGVVCREMFLKLSFRESDSETPPASSQIIAVQQQQGDLPRAG